MYIIQGLFTLAQNVHLCGEQINVCSLITHMYGIYTTILSGFALTT